MTQPVQITNAIEAALIQGDLSRLSDVQRLSYYKQVCDSVGLNCLTQPFAYISLNNKLVLYAKRDATDQLRKIHNVSITIPSRELLGDVYVVTARAKDKNGREDESTGAVCITGLKGEALANAYMKAETKAKRRVTLSACGLGILDESEVETIPGAKSEPLQAEAEVVDISKAQLPAPPQEFDGDPVVDLGTFVFKFGKYRGKCLDQIEIYALNSYCEWLKKSEKPSDEGKLAVKAIEAFLKTREVPRAK